MKNTFSTINTNPAVGENMNTMNIKISLLILSVLFATCTANSQNRISINIPSADAEAEYIWQTIQDARFFEENNYKVSLPGGVFIQELWQKALSASLRNEDYEQLKAYVKDSVFNLADYQSGYAKIENEVALINRMVGELSESDFNWEFIEFKTYQVNLTLYGPGGSYNPADGSIVIYTTPAGQFKSYDNPANTIIHEIVHIGIEETIITRHQVPHALKERIVDTFVFVCFSHYLPDYRIQDMGETRSDTYLKTKADLANLGSIVESIMSGE